jgi:hypothetical protein
VQLEEKLESVDMQAGERKLTSNYRENPSPIRPRSKKKVVSRRIIKMKPSSETVLEAKKKVLILQMCQASHGPRPMQLVT